MKIRLGFVSNSSSATYIISIKGTKEDNLSWIYSSDPHLWEESLLELYQEDLNRTEETIERFKNRNSGTFERNVINNYYERKKKIEEKLNYIKNLPENISIKERIKLTEDYLGHKGITVKYLEGKTILEYYTTMHNWYSNGMPDILVELVLLSKFEHITKLTAKIVKDS